MAKIGNLVHQASTSTGTGNISLSPVLSRRSFNDEFGTGGTDKFYYFILNQSVDEWEFGTGHLFDSTTLVRDTVLGSSNANALVNFSAGNKDIINDLPASLQSQLETPVADSSLARVSGSTYFSIQHLMNLVGSAGVTSGGEITQSSGTMDQIDVDEGTGFIRATDADDAELKFFDWDESLNISIPVDSPRFIGVSYNAGSPIIVVKTTDDWDLDTEFPLGIVHRESDEMHISNIPWITGDNMTNIIERFDSFIRVQRDKRVGGIVLSNTGTRNVFVSAGALLARMSEFPIDTFDSSVSDTFSAYYRDGSGGWTKEASQTQWENTKYDDNSGTLATVPDDRYVSRWFYIETDGHITMLYGQNHWSNLAMALTEQPPSSVPPGVEHLGLIIGRFIILKGATTPDATQSTFDIIFANSSVTNINDLSGILSPAKGGTGVANNVASTLEIDGAFATVFTITGPTNLTLPTSGTVSVVGHTHVASDITDFSEAVDDRVNALIQNGTGLTWSYVDGSNTLTGNVSLSPFSTTNLAEGTSLYFTDERAQDAVGAILTDTATIDFTYNDIGNLITADLKNTTVTASSYGSASSVGTFTVDAQGRLTAASNTAISITSTAITDFAEATDDRVNALVTAGSGIQKSYNDGGNTLTLTASFGSQLLHIQDQKTQNTAGGTFTSGAWRTRDLNTVNVNEISGSSLSTNQITLPAGTYYCEWQAGAYEDNNADNPHQTRLQNITGAATLLLGHVSNTSNKATTYSAGAGRFTLGGTTVIELQHQITSTQTTTGFGVPGNFTTEVYSGIRIWKIA